MRFYAHPKQHLDRFSHFNTAHAYDQQTHIEHRQCYIDNNRLHLMLHIVMRLNDDLKSIQNDIYTHTHTFNGPFSGTTRVSQYQKGKTNLNFTEASDSEWQWLQLGHMQVCTSLQTDNHASTPPLSFYRPDALPAAQSTASKH